MSKNNIYWICLVLALCGVRTSYAQLVTNYPISNHVIITGQPYTDLGTNGSVISTLNTDDALSSAVPIGFSFVFNGVTYTDFILSTNGFLKMGTVAPSSASLFYSGPQSSGVGTGGALNSTNLLDTALIIPFNHDLIGATGAEYRVHTTGSVGSRVCTIQFKNLTEKNTTVAVQYAIINFQVKLYEGSNFIDFIWGPFTSSTNTSSFRSAGVGLKGSSNAANQLVTVTKGSTQTWDAAAFLSGNYTGNAFNYGNNVVTARPLPVAGTTYRFVPVAANDIAIRQVYTLGKMPKDYTSPHFVRAAIRNSGTAAMTSFYVKLAVTGANPFLDSVFISSIAPNLDTIITFAGQTPTSLGYDTVTVFTDPDNNNTNNSRAAIRDVNEVVYSYADPSVPAAGGVGFTGATGDFVAKFPYAGVPNAINQVGVNFNTGGNSLRIGVWNRNTTTGLPGTLLWQSTTFTTVAGLNTIPVNPPVPVNDTFFVGVIQIGTVNAAFSFQNENPIRNQTFYYTSPTGNTTWTDFFATASAFRFMIEPRLQSPNDMGVTDVIEPCRVLPVGQAAFTPKVVVYNYGALAQTAINTKFAIFNQAGTRVYYDSVTTSTLPSSTSEVLTFNISFATSTAGTYTIKSWSELAGDASRVNDTAFSDLVITNLPNVNNAGLFLQFDGADDYITAVNRPSLNPPTEMTIEAWVNPTNFIVPRTIVAKDSAGANRSYRLFVNTTGNLVFTLNTNTGLVTAVSSTPITAGQWTHVAATFDGGTVQLYINGDTAGTALQFGTIVASTVPLYVGKNGPNATDFWVGGIDELKIWNTVRNSQDIRRNMHRRLPNFSSTNLMLYYRFDDGLNASIITDASGNCNSGTTVSMDVQNATVTPAVFISTIPLGQPIVNDTVIAFSGPMVYPNVGVTMNYFNYVGTEEYVIHKFDTTFSTLPTANPGGVSASAPHTWIIYRYGSASYDSIYVTYLLGPGYLSGTASVNDISLFRRSNGNGGGWTLLQNPASAISISPQSATFRFTSAANFRAQFNIAGNNNPLPVSMGMLSARFAESAVQLQWDVYSEINNQGFEIERSFDGLNFEKIDFVKGRINANTPLLYSYADASYNSQSLAVYYRVRNVDVDGTFGEYSNIVRIQPTLSAIASVSVSPNPFKGELNLTLQSLSMGGLTLQLTDLSGRVVSTQTVELQQGVNSISMSDLEQLKPGVYFLKIQLNGEYQVLKVLKH